MDRDELSRDLGTINIVSRKLNRGERISEDEWEKVRELSESGKYLVGELAREVMGRRERKPKVPRRVGREDTGRVQGRVRRKRAFR